VIFRRTPKVDPQTDASRPHQFIDDGSSHAGGLLSSGGMIGPGGAQMVHPSAHRPATARCAVPGCHRGVEDQIHVLESDR
jgi:hypothetical protein